MTDLATDLATDLGTYIDTSDVAQWPITEGALPATPGGELVISGPGNYVYRDTDRVVT